VSKKFSKYLLSFLLLSGGLLIARFVLAQDFGTEAVNNGLNGTLATGDPRTIAARIINIVLGFLGAIVVIILVYAGSIWMTARADAERLARAKTMIKNAIIGLIIILVSWAVATFVLSKLGGAINGNGDPYSCTAGATSACGCGGTMYCTDGSWGACFGSDCNCVGPDCIHPPVNCDADTTTPECSALDQKCDPNDYCDPANCTCQPKGQSGDPCDTNLTNATCNPSNNLCSQYLTCHPETCVCFGPPVITGLSPLGGFCATEPNKSCVSDADCSGVCDKITPNGAPSNFITIFGKNFGTYSATSSRVVFLGAGSPRDGRQPAELNPACLNSWHDNQIIIAIPTGVSNGPIKVINSDLLEDSTGDDYGPKISDFTVNNIVAPGLCELNPNRGLINAPVTYQGINLYSGQAYFGNYQNNVKALSSDFINPNGLNGTSTTPNIRPGDSGSFVLNDLGGNRVRSNYLNFTKDSEPNSGPFISSFSPSSGTAGQYVTVRGQGFGGARGLSRVYFGDTEAVYTFPDVCLNSVWKDTQIIVKVPAGLADGPQVISINLGSQVIDTQKLNPNTFSFNQNSALKTSLCKIEPERGPAATPVSVWGEYFGSENNPGTVRFNSNKNASGTIELDKTAQKIATAVPSGAVTGPVRVIKNGVFGNELNFSIGECSANSDCGDSQVCCPQNTFQQGRCVNSLAVCFTDIPTSVFEWSFNTGLGTTTDPLDSCAGLAKFYGNCQTGQGCPNVPGTCSPYSGAGKKAVATCDYSCSSAPGCEGFSTDCNYNTNLGVCVLGGDTICNLAKEETFQVNGLEYRAVKTCKNFGTQGTHFEITTLNSCPAGWTRGLNNTCVATASCSLCPDKLTCASVGDEERCVSAKLCPSGSVCENNPVSGEADNCVVADTASCDCCCTIGQSARDCCAPLQCEGTCGSDTGSTSGAELGRCGGCKLAGNTPTERDAACSCSGHTGQYCEINNPDFPNGFCTDCSDLIGTNCSDHSSACCLDAKKTPSLMDDVCRGLGSGQLVSNLPGEPGFGYCAYYQCSVENPTQCASTTPVQLGDYTSKNQCVDDCPEDSDPCSAIKVLADCAQESRCCFDDKITSGNKCRLIPNGGSKIAAGVDAGYCARYDCANTEPVTCASATPVKSGQYDSVTTCSKYCGSPFTPGNICIASTTSICSTDKCNFPGFDCLSPFGTVGAGVESKDCGTCCCQPNAATDACSSINSKLECLPDKGNCSGASRGLCCGCSSDNECGSTATIGCGADTCCQARPQIISTLPKDSATNVCRNAVIKVDFDQLMDVISFPANVLLLEERDPGAGACPEGTFITKGESVTDLLAQNKKNNRLFARLFGRLRILASGLRTNQSGSALAALPSDSKLYCSTPGVSYGQNNGEKTSLFFAPQRILSASANYYLVVLGDTELNSQSGVLSLMNIGFNGTGYQGNKNVKFNGRNYANSHIIEFSTLSAQSPMSGVCAIDSVTVMPSSYLFKKSDNGLDENDSNALDKTFDTQADRDKAFIAQAFSMDRQILQPVTGYYWDWDFKVNDSSIADKVAAVSGLTANRVLIAAKAGVTDGETKAVATVKMNRFSAGCSSGSCTCSGVNCSNNCCNAFKGGDGFNAASNLYVFLCNNPWPPVAPDGIWSPWVDTNNCAGIPGCSDYNYKFYYCRDAGTNGTLDDLPAIMNQAVVRGQSSNFACSSDRTSCTTLNAACGLDQNGDGARDGICVWNVLKESYFFRETVPLGGELTKVTDLKTGGEVEVFWNSNAAQANTYKIYYLKSGQGVMASKIVSAATACSLAGGVNECRIKVSGLINKIAYVFKVSVVSVNQTESALSNEKTVTPTDSTPPAVPTSFRNQLIASTTLKFSWNANNDDTDFYRVYRGVNSGVYGASFDSAPRVTSTSVELSDFPGVYFALTAVDANGNESAKTAPITQGGSTDNK
jgi:hypothetical protein